MTHIATWNDGDTPEFLNLAIDSLYWATLSDPYASMVIDPDLWVGWAPVYCGHADHWDIADQYDVLVLQHADAGLSLYIALANRDKPNDLNTAPVLFDMTLYTHNSHGVPESIPEAVLRYMTAWYEDYKAVSPDIMDEALDVYVQRDQQAS